MLGQARIGGAYLGEVEASTVLDPPPYLEGTSRSSVCEGTSRSNMLEGTSRAVSNEGRSR